VPQAIPLFLREVIEHVEHLVDLRARNDELRNPVPEESVEVPVIGDEAQLNGAYPFEVEVIGDLDLGVVLHGVPVLGIDLRADQLLGTTVDGSEVAAGSLWTGPGFAYEPGADLVQALAAAGY